ncbi:hypothetical protein GXP67_10165 [Rhodocytophaga rosea]|uniref:Uncharacterized protein n=1 Tax=Rhodocytophaga rosea TaxID=2704465 RepID=A0A6C0GG51_9BACT|nr:hypothetical protein [Rhodocytophaga rosea]QHT66986.1 hypothetical protein GXP67_10165 [Rhodocytophaga rosea]
MKPEAFDHFCRTKIEQLHELPELDWDEKGAWQKLNIKLSKNYRIFTFTAIALVLAVLLLGISWNYEDRETHLTVANKKTLQTRKLQAKQFFRRPLQGADTLIRVKADVKNTLQPVVHTPIQEKDPILPLPQPIGITTLPAPDSIINTISTKPDTLVPQMLTQPEDSLQATLTNTSRKTYRNTPDIEVYSSVDSDNHSAGFKYVKPLSPRFSLVYGLYAAKTYKPYINMEMHTDSRDVIGLHMPVQIRYYLLPPENRFTVFLYAGLTGALPLSGVTTATYPAMRFETGAEARYRLWESKDGSSKGFLFFRMPLYNRTILNYHYNHADWRIKDNHGLDLGGTSR